MSLFRLFTLLQVLIPSRLITFLCLSLISDYTSSRPHTHTHSKRAAVQKQGERHEKKLNSVSSFLFGLKYEEHEMEKGFVENN